MSLPATIFPVNQPFGPGVVSAKFCRRRLLLAVLRLGSHDHLRVSRSRFLRGGDETDTGSVEFWGHSWSRDNVLSGGPAPDSFKGFASAIRHQSARLRRRLDEQAGQQLETAGHAATLYGRSRFQQHYQVGFDYLSDVPEIVVVTPNPGYEPDPGHPGTGTVVAEFCPQASIPPYTAASTDSTPSACSVAAIWEGAILLAWGKDGNGMATDFFYRDRIRISNSRKSLARADFRCLAQHC